MSVVMIFALGYAIGCVSALLVVGLTRAGRGDGSDRRPIEKVSHDAEHFGL
jgi:hypothetical protein